MFDPELLRQFVTHTDFNRDNLGKYLLETSSFKDSMLNEDNMYVICDEETVWLLRATSSGNKGAPPKSWCIWNADRVLIIARKTRR